MKNLITKILSLTLAALMLLSFAACKKEDADDKVPDNNPPATNNGGDNTGNGDTNDGGNDNGDNWFDTGDGEDQDDEDEIIPEAPEFTYDGIWWLGGRGNGFIVKSIDDDTKEFQWKSDKDGKTWKWNVTAGMFGDSGAQPIDLEEGTIEAIFTPEANIGVAFGAHNFNLPKDGASNVLGTADVKFYYALYKNDGSISFCIDGGDDNKLTTVQKLTITDVIPTFDINADVKLKVDFTKEGTIKICVNDVEVYSFTGYAPFGTQFGMLTEDGIGFEKNAVVGTLKSFTYVDPNAEVAE